MDGCPRLGKWIGGCRFEARYDLGPADRSGLSGLEGSAVSVLKALEKMRAKTYVHDICTTCGKIVRRPDYREG